MGLYFYLATIIRKEMKPESFKLNAPGFLVVSDSQSCSWGYLAMSETFDCCSSGWVMLLALVSGR